MLNESAPCSGDVGLVGVEADREVERGPGGEDELTMADRTMMLPVLHPVLHRDVVRADRQKLLVGLKGPTELPQMCHPPPPRVGAGVEVGRKVRVGTDGEEKMTTMIKMDATDFDIEILRMVIATAGGIAMIPAVRSITVEAREEAEAPVGAAVRGEIGTSTEGGGVEVDREAR